MNLILLVAGVNTDLGMQELLEIETKNELDSNNLGPKMNLSYTLTSQTL